MKTLLSTSAFFLLAVSLAHGAMAGTDPLRATLEESRTSGKGLSFHVNGQVIGGVVVSVDDHFVVARSQAQGTIVIRQDRIDGVSGFVSLPGDGAKSSK